MKRFTLILLILNGIVSSGYGYFQLTIGDPQRWGNDQGTIEEAILNVKPSGLYMEYGLILTFSDRDSWLGMDHDTLEVVLDFDLPREAIVIDSWLWIGEDIYKALLLDKWTASSIYEGIVKRRRDPSILTQVNATQYQLRVFPMARNETRKVKITYLMPVSLSKNSVQASLPEAILRTSRFVPKLVIQTSTNTTWTDPKIIGIENNPFLQWPDTCENCYTAEISPGDLNPNLSIRFSVEFNNDVFFSSYRKGEEGYYQLGILPTDYFSLDNPRKVLFLVDYEENNTNTGIPALLANIKSAMLKNLTERDSFNLIFSNLTINRYSEKWIAASETNIHAAFDNLTDPLSSYSNLPSLLGNGIAFVNTNGGEGKILLISNSDNVGDYSVANVLIQDIRNLLSEKIQIHVCDIQNQNFTYFYFNNKYYWGNDYFYLNLSRLTSGVYQRLSAFTDLDAVLSSSFRYLGGSISSFDLYTHLENGFCHSRYNLNSSGNTMVYLSDAIMQVGKFSGDFPFYIEFSGILGDEVFSYQLEISEENALASDKLSGKIWAGQLIKNLQQGTLTNNVIDEVIYNSLNYRILSYYTAFLCIEDSSLICENCNEEEEDPQIPISREEIVIRNDSLLIYPNPVSDILTIELHCSDPGQVEELAIYNLAGAVVYRFDPSELQKGKNILYWDCSKQDGEKAKSGVYLLIYRNAQERKVVKLVIA